MILPRFLSRLIPLAAIVMAAVSTAQAVPVVTDVVFGNLGATGSDPLSATNTDFGGGTVTDTVAKLAQGFTTGSSSQYLKVQSVTLGLFSNDSPSTRTVSIYTNNAGVPGSAVFTSTAQNVTTTGKYTFSFSGVTLDPSTSYWIVPEGPASWYFNNDEIQPTEQNASGWSYLGTKRALTASPSTWSNSSGPYSVSITAVPEPSTYAMAAAGLGAIGLFRWRRRRAG